MGYVLVALRARKESKRFYLGKQEDEREYKRMFRVQELQKTQKQQDIVFIFVIVHPATSKEDASSGLKDRSRSRHSDKPLDPAP